MTSRYLTISEVSQTLQRGMSIEAFLGGFQDASGPAIRRLWLKLKRNRILSEVWGSPNLGSVDHLDLYQFGTLNHDDAPICRYSFDSIEEAVEILEKQFPGVSTKFVNEGVV